MHYFKTHGMLNLKKKKFRLIRVNLYDLRPSHLIRSTLKQDLITRFYSVALTLSYPSL